MDRTHEIHIHLPVPLKKGGMTLAEAINLRRSVRRFTTDPISQSQLSQILWAAQGITGSGRKSRAVPSAGETYPLEIYVVCGKNCIDGANEGIYHYEAEDNLLRLHYSGDVRLELASAALDQRFLHEAPVDLVICAQHERTLARYSARGERYVYMEVGHAGQNIYLQATALGLATVAVGAFHDEQVSQVLKLDRKTRPLYIMPIGKPT